MWVRNKFRQSSADILNVPQDTAHISPSGKQFSDQIVSERDFILFSSGAKEGELKEGRKCVVSDPLLDSITHDNLTVFNGFVATDAGVTALLNVSESDVFQPVL